MKILLNTFEQMIETSTITEIKAFASENNLDIYVAPNASMDLLIADIRCSLYIKLDMSSADKAQALRVLNELKASEVLDESLFS